MKKIALAVLAAILLISLFSAASAEKNGMRIYGPGSYEVGKNFKKGEYIIFSAEEEARFVVSVDEEGLDVISEGAFKGNTILKVENDDYLQLIDCTAALADDYYSAFKIELSPAGGTLKVGADIDPGTYELLAQEGQESAYRVYEDGRYHTVSEEGTFQKRHEVHVSKGQYLELTGCRLGGLVSDTKATDKSAQPHSMRRTPAPDSAPGGKPQGGPESPENKNAAELNPPEIDGPKVRILPSKTPVVRSEPSTKGDKVGTAEAETEYALLETEGKWYKIRLHDGEEGWITSSMAEIVEESDAQIPNE
ncbi:MAG: SH3 domain-containing protein [Lachnospiraceae bacterium]|nr:SH3 domain-containing protein [Lachnospiraceae bacterium]